MGEVERTDEIACGDHQPGEFRDRIEPQYFWAIMFFVAAFAAGWELAHRMRKR